MGFSKRFELDVNGNEVEFLVFMEEEENDILINQMVGYEDVQILSSVRITKLKMDSNGNDIESEMGMTIYDMITDMEEKTARKYTTHLINKYLNGEI